MTSTISNPSPITSQITKAAANAGEEAVANAELSDAIVTTSATVTNTPATQSTVLMSAVSPTTVPVPYSITLVTPIVVPSNNDGKSVKALGQTLLRSEVGLIPEITASNTSSQFTTTVLPPTSLTGASHSTGSSALVLPAKSSGSDLCNQQVNHSSEESPSVLGILSGLSEAFAMSGRASEQDYNDSELDLVTPTKINAGSTTSNKSPSSKWKQILSSPLKTPGNLLWCFVCHWVDVPLR